MSESLILGGAPTKFLILGHRGSPYKERENTVASFEAALQAGADGFETDLRLLSDRTAVLYHDDDVGEDACETLSSRDFAERGLVVDQLDTIASFAGRGTIVLEVKRSKWEEILIEHVERWPGIVVASFDHTTIAELHRRRAAFPLGITIAGAIVDVAPYAKRIGATWLFPNFHFADAELVAAAHAEGLTVVPWTANRRSDWERLREIGCDGVITDFPDRAVQWLKSISC
jgi:glycerophosphoryl diester phosphodiesterase